MSLQFAPILPGSLLREIKASIGTRAQASFVKNQRKVTEYLQCCTVYPLKSFDVVRNFLENPNSYCGPPISLSMRQSFAEIAGLPTPALFDDANLPTNLKRCQPARIVAVIKSYNIFCEAINRPEMKVTFSTSDMRLRFVYVLLQAKLPKFYLDSLLLHVPILPLDEGDVPPPEPSRRPAVVRRLPPSQALWNRGLDRNPALASELANVLNHIAASAPNIPVQQDEGALQLLESPAVNVNPICLICCQLLTSPVRFHTCKHNSYFDLDCYKQTNPNNKRKACPHPGCASKYNANQLRPVELNLIPPEAPQAQEMPTVYDID